MDRGCDKENTGDSYPLMSSAVSVPHSRRPRSAMPRPMTEGGIWWMTVCQPQADRERYQDRRTRVLAGFRQPLSDFVLDGQG